jgi:ribonuclease D
MMTVLHGGESRDNASVVFIESQPAFDAQLGRLRSERLLALDTEAASFHRYLDRIYLIQVSSREFTLVIDPLGVGDLRSLGSVLADPAVEVVFHDADYDLRILDRDYGFRGVNLFDTRVAAQFLNEPAIGLAALLEKYLGVTLDKRFQRADWSLRPLTPEMLAYAAADTRHLPDLRDLLAERLRAAGRWSWVQEEFELLSQVRWTPPGQGEEPHLRIKGARALRGKQLTVLRELHAWREAAAKQADRAPFRVLSNELLIEIAKALPDQEEGLRAVAGMAGSVMARRGKELLAAVRAGIASPEDSIHPLPRNRRSAPEPWFEAQLERLKTARNEVARRLDLAPGLVCPNGTLEALTRAQPKTAEELIRVPGFRRWQAETFGEELLAVIRRGRP